MLTRLLYASRATDPIDDAFLMGEGEGVEHGAGDATRAGARE